MHARLDAIATLLDQGAADSAVRLLRSSWEPEMPAEERAPMYCMWIRGLCETGELHSAVILARRAADEFPRDVDILVALGNVHDLLGDLEHAREAFAAAVELQPRGILQRYNLGAVLERIGEESEAERCYRRAIEGGDAMNVMVEAHAALGALLRRQGRLTEAEEVYDEFLGEDPLNVDMLVEHGICLSDLERFEEAIERFDVAVSFDSLHGGAHYNKAITLFRMGRYPDAVLEMRLAHRADPHNPLTLAVLGSWLLSSPEGDLDEALSLAYRALDELVEIQHRGQLAQGYASLVVEELFEALWHNARPAEAREVARVAGQWDWITPHMLETINRADRAADAATKKHNGVIVSAFRVTAKAQAGERPEHWPEDADGYTTDLTVVAGDEDEARELTVAYLRSIDRVNEIAIEVSIVGAVKSTEAPPDPVRGVARVESCKAYFRE